MSCGRRAIARLAARRSFCERSRCSDLVGLHLTVLPARPADGRVARAPVRCRGDLASIRSPSGIPPARHSAVGAQRPLRRRAHRASEGGVHGPGARLQPAARGGPEHDARAAADRARPRPRPAPAISRPAHAGLLGGGATSASPPSSKLSPPRWVWTATRSSTCSRVTPTATVSTARPRRRSRSGSPASRASCSTAACSSWRKPRSVFEQALGQLGRGRRGILRFPEVGYPVGGCTVARFHALCARGYEFRSGAGAGGVSAAPAGDRGIAGGGRAADPAVSAYGLTPPLPGFVGRIAFALVPAPAPSSPLLRLLRTE